MNQPAQAEIKVNGESLVKLPDDLFIPPEALEIFLDSFEGPLDLLLYLIRKQNIDILNIPIAAITEQYMEYVELMRKIRLDLAAEYLLMAAMLAQIKSRMLLPRQVSGDDEDDDIDPRTALISQLQQYEQFTKAAKTLDDRERLERELYLTHVHFERHISAENLPQATLNDLAVAFRNVMERAQQNAGYQIRPEGLSLRDRMNEILGIIKPGKRILFEDLFTLEEGREGVVVSFMAILELVRDGLLDIIQNENFSPIHVSVAS
ncbi:MAG: segregation and condensation protein A [Saprospiraceae bacterium]|jgi:segregation and condensation protein A